MTDNTSCVACSGELVRMNELENDTTLVAACVNCDGLHVEADDFVDVERFVVFEMVADAPPERMRFFDVTWFERGQGRRSHGWMDRETRRVVQFG